MVRILSVVLSLAIAWGAFSQSAYAVGEDVFVVPRVAVQARDDSATAAKNAAQAVGRRRAMDILLRRLTVEEDWPRLPVWEAPAPEPEEPLEPASEVSAEVDPYALEAEANAAADEFDISSIVEGFLEPARIILTDDMLENLESGFEVYSEKSSSRTYRAFITYRFKPEEVRKLLKDAQIPYSEAQTRTALVVPVLQTGNGLYLWEANNPWMTAWKARPFDNELTPLIAPLGDLEDNANVSARQALAANSDAFAAMAQRYSAPQVIVAHALLTQRNGNDILRVRFINAYMEQTGLDQTDILNEFGDQGLDDAFGDSQGMPTQSQAPFRQTRPGDVLAEAVFRQPSGSFPSLAERAIEETIARYAKPWKEQTLIDHTVAAFLNVSAVYSSLNEWSQIRSALTATPLVSAVQVRALSRGGAELVIQAFGDPEKLVVAMDAQGLVLWNYDEDYWAIATPAAVQRWRADRRRRDWFDERADAQSTPIQRASFPLEQGY